MKDYRQCRCGTWCATGYCEKCRKEDEVKRYQARAEKRKKKAS